jgi:hypothetical protein
MTRCWATYAAALSLLLSWTAPARAWVEWHAQNEDVRVDMTAPDATKVDHTIRYRVVMGPLKFIDVVGIHKSARLTTEATVIAEDGRTFTAHAEPLPDRPGDGGTHVIRITVDPENAAPSAKAHAKLTGLKRGTYSFTFHYELDTLALLSREGGFARVGFTGAEAVEGYDNAKLTFIVPSGGSEPERAGISTELLTVKRGPSSDEVEIVRPHIAKGETPTWGFRVDPKTFPQLKVRETPSEIASSPVRHENRLPIVLFSLFALGVSALFGFALRAKERAAWRAWTGGGSLALAMFMQAMHVLYKTPAWFGLLPLALAVAVAGASRRAAAPVARPLALRAEHAFRALGFLDALGVRGFALFTAIVTAWMLIAPRLAVLGPNAPVLFAANLGVLIPLFFTGGVPLPSRGLAQVFARLRRRTHLKVAPIGGSNGGEVRLLIQPRGAMPGLVALEARDAHGFEVCARVREGSPSERILRAQRQGRTVSPGHETDERVFSYVKASAQGLEATIERLAATLSDRRTPGNANAYHGADRRLLIS